MSHQQPSGEDELAELYRSIGLKTETSIRVLDLLPGRRGTEIRISLRVVDMSSGPDYEALSYTWGESSAGRSILVNEIYRLPVTDNLFHALRGLRRRSMPSTLWIDRICINQPDLEERGHQVGFMGHIYSQATCVNVHLGEPPSRTIPISLRAIGIVAKEIGGVSHFCPPTRRSWRGVFDLLRNRHRVFIKALENNEPQWQTRAWTVQEFVLAKKAFLCCGSYRMLYHEAWLDTIVSFALDRFPSWLAFTSLDVAGVLLPLEESTSRMQRFKRLEVARETASVRGDEIRDIYKALSWLVRKWATNPLDHVHSLLGMIEREEASFIMPNYTLLPSEVHATATYSSIRFRKNFDIFDFVGIRTPRSKAELPSWSVDFSSAPEAEHSSQYFGLYDDWFPHYKGSLLFSDCYLGQSSHHLTVSAVVLDDVVDTLPCHANKYFRLERHKPPTDWLEKLKVLIKHAAQRFDLGVTTLFEFEHNPSINAPVFEV